VLSSVKWVGFTLPYYFYFIFQPAYRARASRVDGRMWLIGANLGYIIRVGSKCRVPRASLSLSLSLSPVRSSPSSRGGTRAKLRSRVLRQRIQIRFRECSETRDRTGGWLPRIRGTYLTNGSFLMKSDTERLNVGTTFASDPGNLRYCRLNRPSHRA